MSSAAGSGPLAALLMGSAEACTPGPHSAELPAADWAQRATRSRPLLSVGDVFAPGLPMDLAETFSALH